MASSSDDQGHHGGAAFDSLPDELVLKIVKLAAKSEPLTIVRHMDSETLERFRRQRSVFTCVDGVDHRIPKTTLRATTYDHNFLLNVVGKISVRFRNIAADKSLWKGFVYIGNRQFRHPRDDVSEDGIATLARDFLGGETKVLQIYNLRAEVIYERWTPLDGEVIRPETICALSNKCPEMVHLSLHGLRMESWPRWPSSYNSWDSLEYLVLNRLQLNSDLFINVQLHRCFPNLKHVILDRCEPIGGEPINPSLVVHRSNYNGVSITLPDVSECMSLEVFEIRNGLYRFATDLKIRIPFPPSLKKWLFWPERIFDVRGREFDKNTSRYHEYLMDLMRDHMKDCEISAWLQ